MDELYTQCISSVLKQAPALSMPSLWHTRCYQSPSSATGIALLGSTSLVPRGSWFVRCLQRHNCLGRHDRGKSCGLCCPLVVYCSVIYQQYFTGLGPKHEKADCKMTTDREDHFPVRSRKNKISLSQGFCNLQITRLYTAGPAGFPSVPVCN